MTTTPPDFPTATVPGSLTPERFARARVIFEAALDRAIADRAAFVDGACVDDEPLRREVLGMLSADALERPEAARCGGS